MIVLLAYILAVLMGAAVFAAGIFVGYRFGKGQSPFEEIEERVAKRSAAVLYPPAPESADLPRE